ncbi:Alpha/beta hydrolase family protein [Rathayibacter tanaceti]|uniref:Alpha/beta hydrolase family protein n=1 Tax=Rathayibacter tanaceti TaxID=1671680 RepID=A0A162IYV2_9MICO|nr:Alpha/beta hydrolase family protein [Rathayibacter tanaceti]
MPVSERLQFLLGLRGREAAVAPLPLAELLRPPLRRRPRMTLTAPTSPHTARHFDEPEGIAARGTLIVLGGRGETPAVYERFGTRIARDAYRVRALGDATAPGVREEALALLGDPEAVSPVVLVGSDAGASVALEIAATLPDAVDAVIVAGLPVRAEGGEGIAERTACPTHAGVLEREADAGARDAVLPPELLAVAASAVRAPLLALHGEADAISPAEEAVAVYRTAPRAEVHLLAGGRHDALNDATHRSAAATVVLFLERVKASAATAEIITRVDA